MADDTRKLTVRCPECNSELVIDAATGEVLSHRKARQPIAGGKDFDSLLRGLDEEKAHAEDIFQREVAALKDRDRLLEEKFREALRRAEEEPDDVPPPRPFDLD
jgi:regulator of sirC expression with transglutaminase-like and TPR domain